MNREILGRLKKISERLKKSYDVEKFDLNLSILNKSTQSEAAKLFALPDRKEIQNRTRIARIFTDTSNPCASASSVQSVFYPKRFDPVSAFICVHLRLNEQDHTVYSGKWG